MQRVSRAEFARMQGWSKSYVTKLGQQGRLVDVDGLVDVEASLAKIRGTTTAPARAAPQVVGRGFVDAAEEEKFWNANLRRVAFRKEIGALREAGDVAAKISAAGIKLRSRLEQRAYIQAPQLVGLDEHSIRVALHDFDLMILAEFERDLSRLKMECEKACQVEHEMGLARD